VLGEQCQQPGQAGRVIADPRPGQQRAVPVGEGDVVVVFGPVDPAKRPTNSSYSSSVPSFTQLTAAQGTRAP
jgi:hypothetical protein